MWSQQRSAVWWLAVGAFVVAACGGGDDASEADDTAGAVEPTSDESDDGADSTAGGDDAEAAAGGGSVVVGEPTLTAEPGTAWAEADGERFDYQAAGSINVECTITDQQVTVNFQTPEGHDFLVQGSPQTGEWFLSTTFAPGSDSTLYTTDSMSGAGTFTVGDGALSFEGTVSRVVDFDVAGAQDVDAQVAANCASAGGDPTATVAGNTFTFPLGGAQSVTCEVSDTSIEVRINRLAVDDLQLEVSGSDQNGQWVGAAVVYTADGNFTSTFEPDGSGLTIDGATVNYQGTFQSPTGDDVEGTVDVAC